MSTDGYGPSRVKHAGKEKLIFKRPKNEIQNPVECRTDQKLKLKLVVLLAKLDYNPKSVRALSSSPSDYDNLKFGILLF